MNLEFKINVRAILCRYFYVKAKRIRSTVTGSDSRKDGFGAQGHRMHAWHDDPIAAVNGKHIQSALYSGVQRDRRITFVRRDHPSGSGSFSSVSIQPSAFDHLQTC